MKAVLLTRHGGAEVLRMTNVPRPEPKRGEVRVKIAFIGINFAEVLSRRGLYGWAPRLPYILGMEASGVVDAVGDGVTGYAPGDAVVVGTQYGTYAEFICLPAGRVLPAPPRFSPRECAAFGVSFLTAWVGLMEMARLRVPDTVLITSAAGGVGSSAVQLASKFGARVIGAASRGKQEMIRSLGAAVALDYSDSTWGDQLRAATEGRGVNVALEMSGGDVYRTVVRNLAPMGRVVVAGASSAFPGSRNPVARLMSIRNFPRPSILHMLKRSYGVMSFHIGWLLDSGAIAPHWRALTSFVEEHHIRPAVGEEFAFDDIANAQRALEEKRNIGKGVVRIAG
jgi:NADPH2:quinone reductase